MPVPRTQYQHFINIISSDTIPEPRMRWLFLKLFSPSKIGFGTIPWPGGRIYNSIVGKHCGVGMGTIITDSTIGDESVICAKAEVTDAVIGKKSFVAANARVTGEIPDQSFVTGTNKIRKRDFTPRDSKRDIEKVRFDGYPVWDWEAEIKMYGMGWMLSLMPQHFLINTIALGCKNEISKRRLASIYCNVSKSATVHYSAVLDSVFPQEVTIKDKAFIDRDCLLLTHSFVDEAGYVLEKGKIVVGEKSIVGADSVVLPGVEIPDNVKIPQSSLVTDSGPFLVHENRKLSWKEVTVL